MATKRKHTSDSESSDDEELTYYSDEEGGIRVDDIYIPPPPKRNTDGLEIYGPRIIITKIVNTNFKSYGSIQILGPFHKNFNAIVGPNGSGKSNVIDSLLFVFGYRASKIRSKKLSVLLHKSSTFPQVSFCSVSVHFVLIRDKEGNANGFEFVPNSEIIVTRTVNRDNTSFYTLNGYRVQYKEIASCLRKHGIDLDHNRFLILQGEVEQISLMKPKAQTEHDTGMLEYLEDIIGTTRFKEPLNKIDEKIDILSELRHERLNRVSLVEREKDELQAPMQEAVKFLELENTVTKKKNFLFQRQIKRLNENLVELEEKKSDLEVMEKSVKASLQNLSDEKKVQETKFQEQNKEYESLQKRKTDLKEMLDKATNRDVTIVAEMQESSKRRKKIVELLKDETKKLEDLERVPERNAKKIDELVNHEKKLTSDKENLEEEKNKVLGSLRKETLVMQQKKETIQTKLVDLQKTVDDTKSAFTIAESELKLFLRNEETEKNKLDTMKTTFEENKAKLNERTKQLKETKQQLPAMENAYKEALGNLDRVRIEEAHIINEIKKDRIQLEETRSAQQASKSRGRVLDSLTQQKNNGNLPGLFGRLGDLGAIDQKYDIAISTACGPLDNIVVDTVDTAQWCIEYLKKYNIGRATFIALDKQEHLREYANNKIKTPENVFRLYDLIKIEDERVRTAFYYALRDTLVANNIDQATRIAYGSQRYRVVTLQGQLIEMSGTMSGGGTKVSRGRMGQSVTVHSNTGTDAVNSPRKLHDMETKLERLEQRARDLHNKQQSYEDQVNRLKGEVRQLKIDLEKCNIEVDSLQKQQPILQQQIKKQEQKVKECAVNPAQVKKLQSIVNSKKIEYENANGKAIELQKQVDLINKDIKDCTEKKMKPINKQLKEYNDMLEKCKAEIVKLNVGIKTSERNLKKTNDKINNLEQEKKELETKLRTLSEERKTIEEDATKLVELIDQVDEKLNEGSDEFNECRKYLDDINKKITKFKSEKIELDQKLNIAKGNVIETNEELKRFQTKLISLTLQEIPDKEKELLRIFSPEELDTTDTKHMETELKREEEQLKNSRPNLTAITEYKAKQVMYLERVKEVEEVTSKRSDMRKLKDDLRQKRQTEFQAGFNIISQKLKEMYQLITLGGDAELEMVDTYDPFAEGIVLNVRPPKKSWKNITNLSGGEKTLSSLALVFALHYYKPSPLYFMDEIDAALDFKNVSIVGNYIKERTKNAQFIIISLRSNMFELADHLVGIYKTYDITKSITISARHIKSLADGTEFDESDEEDDDLEIECHINNNINKLGNNDNQQTNTMTANQVTNRSPRAEYEQSLDEGMEDEEENY